MKSCRVLALLFGYLSMSMVDGIGVAVDRLGNGYGFPASVVAALPVMIFVWFLLLSLPFGFACERFGRRRVAFAGLAMTAAAMFIPLAAGLGPAPVYLAAFALLGVANVAMQVALPPMAVESVPAGGGCGRVMAFLSAKTAMAAAIPFFIALFAMTGHWEAVFPAGGLLAVVAAIAVFRLPADCDRSSGVSRPKFSGVVRLLADPFVALLVAAFALGVCQDVWLNLAMPGMQRDYYGWGDARLGYGATTYFAVKIPAMLAGAVLLPRSRLPVFGACSVAAVAAGIGLLLVSPPICLFFAAVVLVSLGSANFYGVVFGMLAARHPDRTDALSALLVMSISSGALVAPIMSMLGR